ncbi:MAG: sugar ABC transporter permease [Clostridiales bacterium]|nr:sugar ABC transporter permease [Clostridiales bacterium]
MMKQNQKGLTLKQSGWIFCAALLVLPCLNTLIFTVYVNISSLRYAFTDDRTGLFTWANFETAFLSFQDTSGGDSLFSALGNTLQYFLAEILIIPISVALTFFLFKRIAGYNAFRIIFFLPSIIPGLVWVTAYKEIMSMNGVLGQLMEAIGQPMEVGVFKNPETATPALVAYTMWLGLAGGMLYYFSAMSRIPDSIFEAALIDGFGPIREIFQIVLPLIGPTIGTLLLLKIAGFIGATGPILLFTKGAAGTQTLNFILYYRVLEDPTGGIGVVSAIGIIMTVISLPLAFGSRFMINKYLPSIEY